VRCQEIRQQLAVYRELTAVERELVDHHLTSCPGCAATLAAYRAQDELLSTLPVLRPSPALDLAVRTHTAAQHRPARTLSWRWTAVTVSLLLLIYTAWSTVTFAADALPGDPLYPLKRGAEQVRLVLTLDLAARDQYRQQLAESRREEVRAVVRLQREAHVQFQGDLVAIEDGVWLVDGLQVEVGSTAWVGVPPPMGSTLSLEAQASNGRLTARRLRLVRPPLAQPMPEASPTAPVGPLPTPTCTGTATLTRRTPGGQPPTGPTQTRPAPGPSTEPRGMRTPPPGPHRSATPGPQGPGRQPSATPGPQGPGPRGSSTPGPPGPGPQPSATPGPPDMGPQPSAASTPAGPGPPPSATPVSRGPGPQPSPTPGRGGR
jgi:predicted anti-sigma-YlaC factor YlaD